MGKVHLTVALKCILSLHYNLRKMDLTQMHGECENIMQNVFVAAVNWLPVIEWLDSFLSFSPAKFCRVRKSEKCRSKLHKPLWINGSTLPHIFFGSEYQLMINHPVTERTYIIQPWWCILSKLCTLYLLL